MAAQLFAQTIGGLFLVPALQLLKKWIPGLKGAPMLWTAFLGSWVTALIAVLATGGVGAFTALLSDPLEMFKESSVVMTVATVVYQSVKDRLQINQPKQ
jgi:hypothetical protein